MTDLDVAAIHEMRREGYTYDQIGRNLGISKTGVANVLNDEYEKRRSIKSAEKLRLVVRPHTAGPDITMQKLMAGR